MARGDPLGKMGFLRGSAATRLVHLMLIIAAALWSSVGAQQQSGATLAPKTYAHDGGDAFSLRLTFQDNVRGQHPQQQQQQRVSGTFSFSPEGGREIAVKGDVIGFSACALNVSEAVLRDDTTADACGASLPSIRLTLASDGAIERMRPGGVPMTDVKLYVEGHRDVTAAASPAAAIAEADANAAETADPYLWLIRVVGQVSTMSSTDEQQDGVSPVLLAKGRAWVNMTYATVNRELVVGPTRVMAHTSLRIGGDGGGGGAMSAPAAPISASETTTLGAGIVTSDASSS